MSAAITFEPFGQANVQKIGDDRVRIHTGGAGEPAARALLEWLKAREDVVKVRYHRGTGAIDVRYREEGSTGAFVRSLRDRAFLVSTPAPRKSFRVAVGHSIEGRARLRLEGAGDEDLVRLAAWLADLPGVQRASPSPASASILVQYDPREIAVADLLAAIGKSDPASWPDAPLPPKRLGWTPTAINTLVFAAAATGLAPLPVAGAAAALTAIPSAKRALRAMREKRLSVDVLDLAAIGISIGTGQPATAAFITWLLGLGDLVLERTSDRARAAISKLMKLDATTAWRIDARGEVVQVAVKKLAVGDRVVVEPGARVPADGVVESGHAAVDEKALTGESMPQEKRAGDRVMAATVVVEGQLVVVLDRVGTDTTAAKIVRILEGAGNKPMTLQRETEKVADRLVLPTFGVAGGAAFLASQIDRMTSVLITDFGTGIRIAVPTSALAAMTIAAREGVLVKGGQYLERLAKADVIVFDKTGTLTLGEPEILDVTLVASAGSRSVDEVLALAASAEGRQGHPLAEALRAYASKRGLATSDAELGTEEYAIGLGLRACVRGRDVLVGSARLMDARDVHVPGAAKMAASRDRARGASTLYIAIDGKLEAVVGYADEPRKESADVVRALKANGRREVVLLSGDAKAPVEAVGRAVGVDRVHAELMPEDKARIVKDLQRAGKIVAMVGDGINDAPALAVADVGVSLEGGTDVALETADVVLLEGGLAKLPDAFAIADRAMRHVRRGLGLVIVPNAAAIVLGAVGLLTPGMAAVVNNGSTVIAALAAASPLLRRSPR